MLNLKFKSWMDSNKRLCTWNIEWGIGVEYLVSGGCQGWPASEQPLGGQQGFDEGNSSLGLLPEINNCYLRNSLRFNKLWKLKKTYCKTYWLILRAVWLLGQRIKMQGITIHPILLWIIFDYPYVITCLI